MKKVVIKTECKKMLADVFTPVSIYLRLRDRFRDTILLESTDSHAEENSYSFICINAIAGIEILSDSLLEYKLPARNPEKIEINKKPEVPLRIGEFMERFEITTPDIKEGKFAQGLFGYTTYDAVQFFEDLTLNPRWNNVGGQASSKEMDLNKIPLMRYRLYQYVIAIHHFKDELFICENKISGLESELLLVESLIRSKDVPVYPFKVKNIRDDKAVHGNEISNMSDDDYLEMVKKGIQSCHRGDVFQIVLSRRFEQQFTGDDFNVYRALRSINPSPYLFYFDYGDYKLMGSSPESQLIIQNSKAIIHPIAGTYKRTGDDEIDKKETEKLLKDAKENAEHIMLVDLARNDLSRVCDEVQVTYFRQVQYFSHVIHLVSEVTGKLKDGSNPFGLLAKTFPAGTLSGAPKYRAMELIDEFEPASRGFYGGCIGFIGFDGGCNHAIMIRTFLSKNNTLIYQAGAGVVAASNPETELLEVNNKLAALKKAIELAASLNPFEGGTIANT